ncbi:glycoside hydrolase family 16 [Blastococcus sp. TF02A-30]|nr:glycoside hydrolase family 16 [Blastococcus sp. TF02A-30]
MPAVREQLDERFPGSTLDPEVWFPWYLPHWSSRAESAATYDVRDGELHLTIPPDQPLWCSELHDEPLRVSCVQSGSAPGQQPFADGLVVREQHPPFRGYTPRYGRVEVRMRGVVDAGSMVAFWMSGIEDVPEHSGEICVAEIFGDAVRPGSAEVGMGVKAFRDPGLRQDFVAPRLDLDVARFHDYAVEWAPGSLAFRVDGAVVRTLDQAPGYPVQLMIGVFDFPARAGGREPGFVPELVVASVRGTPAVG